MKAMPTVSQIVSDMWENSCYDLNDQFNAFCSVVFLLEVILHMYHIFCRVKSKKQINR